VTPSTHDRGHDRDAVPNGHPSDFSTGLDDAGRELMTKGLRQGGTGERVWPLRGDDRSDYVLVEVGAADTAPGHLNEYIVLRLNAGLRNVLEPDVLLVVEASC
jgi:hypothetical protein